MDDIIWQVINQNFCSYKVKANTQNFCKNEYNVTGICNRQSCPLANSQYATIKEKKGILYLYMKTIERSHMPSKTWEKIKLSRNYTKALKQIDKKLLYWSDFLIHKNKARLTRLTQYLIKTKRLSLKKQPKIIGIKPKQVRRETTREKKALKIAKLEKSIEKELLERLKNGIYGEEPLNVDRNIWKKVLGLPKNQEKDENESEYENSEKYVRFLSKKNNLEEWLKKYKHTRNEDFIEDFIALNSDESEENDINNKENEQEIEDIFQKKRKHYYKQSKTPKRSKAYIELEYEQENQLTDKKM